MTPNDPDSHDVTPHVFHPPVLILRGLLSLAFGILALLWPLSGLLAIALLYGAYAFVDGILAIAAGVRRGTHHQSWILPMVEGLFGLCAGVVTFVWPGLTLFVLSILIGAWAISTGILELMGAFGIRSLLPTASNATRILLGLAGIFSIVLGAVIFAFPPLGALTLITFVAGYALAFGILMISMGIQLLRHRRHEPGRYEVPRAA